ncbi:DUF2332 domain-containing protein [Homoserinibacter sp. YIM 151385]|uniref:DUF2332 domain-containing protein n=1 Tax=Homoserinibacter sp. YIM 151385 TaxID=2985506 RepID=UPI0022F09EB4|nr:DUF2332 domain-containing protein [Homoserinibacter sp. YIM 151385]WBU39033.1 DUF2332 domain-containing protein [Homoserinibacter sp. YIM 151385]
MRPTDSHRSTAERYRVFAEVEAAGLSPAMEAWASGIAGDAEALELIGGLPEASRQPNLVLAAARLQGASGAWPAFRETLLGRWSAISATAVSRSTQTNEAARCALLLPALSLVEGPIALIEVGAAAGLCLLPDRYSYRYRDAAGSVRASLDPAGGPSPVVLDCTLEGEPELRMPEVVWRAGIDLNPLDPRDGGDAAWLEALIWPEHEDRRRRLRAALSLAAAEPPRIVPGDLLVRLPEVLAEVPAGVTPVVVHTAVIAYLPAPARERFAELMRDLPARWISNEGRGVVPGIRPHPAALDRPSDFVLALEGEQLAETQPHGRALRWLGRP